MGAVYLLYVDKPERSQDADLHTLSQDSFTPSQDSIAQETSPDATGESKDISNPALPILPELMIEANDTIVSLLQPWIADYKNNTMTPEFDDYTIVSLDADMLREIRAGTTTELRMNLSGGAHYNTFIDRVEDSDHGWHFRVSAVGTERPNDGGEITVHPDGSVFGSFKEVGVAYYHIRQTGILPYHIIYRPVSTGGIID